MRKRLISLCLSGLLLLTAGCGQTEPVSPTPETPPEEAAEPIDPHTLNIEIPEEYRDLLIITTDFPTADEHRISLLSVQEKASAEAMEKDFGSGAGGGLLFGISAMDQVGFEQFLQYDYSGCDVFARDETWYYAKTYPTDVQFYRSGGVIDSETEDWKSWEALNALGDQVCQDVITRNGLTPYSQWEIRNASFTWEGDHAYAKYYAYYSFDGSKDQFDTLLLSQPAKQGEGGLWCVERFYDEYGSLYLYFPESGVPAAEYYAALQAECDKGEHPELLTPLGAAKDFVANSGWYSDTPTDENVELTEGIDSDYSETNQRMSRVIASLLVIFLLIVGMFIETLSATIIVAPILMPVAAQYGIDPIQFAMVMIITLVYAGVTPPVGGVLFITMGIAKVKMKETLKYLPPYLGVVCISLLLLIFFPKISLFLPHLLF